MPVTKSFMIKTIMEELGIARLEDVVYVDDQPFNLSEVFKALPGVAVCLPNSIDVVVREFFTKENYTDEDRSRVARYRSEEARNRASINYKGDYLEFLSTCDMTAQVRVPEEHEIDRVLDLIQRANRLSIMSAVVPEAELRADRQFIRACWSKDKFGDNGLIGVLYARHNVVSIFVVSCTMQNKGIGSYLLGSVINEHLGSQLTVGWKPTEYNKPMLQLLNYFGFKRDESMDEVLKDGIELYRLKATQAVDLPYWIKPYER
jgi:FkbH-like protein